MVLGTVTLADAADWASLVGLVLAIAAIVLAVLAFLDTRRESNAAEARFDASSDRTERILEVLLELRAEATEDPEGVTNRLDEVVDRVASGTPLSLGSNVLEDEMAEAIGEEVGDGVDVTFSRRLMRRGRLTMIVGTKRHGLWKVTRRDQGGYNAKSLVDADKPMIIEPRPPPSSVLTAVAAAGGAQDGDPLDQFRRKERGSPLWVLRLPGEEWWQVRLANRNERTCAERVEF